MYACTHACLSVCQCTARFRLFTLFSPPPPTPPLPSPVQDANDIKEALRNAGTMIAELRTSLLTPKVYYELYMDVFNQLGSLEMYIAHLQRSGTSMKETYELVQHTGNVLVRL